ncbi:MAG: hypothetical protein ACYTGG_00035 [Planctomycetota bacterium]
MLGPTDIARLVAFFLSPFVGVWPCRRAIRHRRPYPACRECGYALIGILGTRPRCPECGAPITRGRFLDPQELSRWWRWLFVFGFMLAACGGTSLLALPVILILRQVAAA